MMNGVETKIKNENLTQKASKSVFWSFVSTWGVSAIRFITTAIIARILSPSDFGIVGMAMIVNGLINIFGQVGFGAALIQKRKSDDGYLSTAFWVSVVVGFMLAMIAVVSAPLPAVFFKQPVLKNVMYCLSVNFFLSGLAAIHSMHLFRDLRFKDLKSILLFLLCAMSISAPHKANNIYGKITYVLDKKHPAAQNPIKLDCNPTA